MEYIVALFMMCSGIVVDALHRKLQNMEYQSFVEESFTNLAFKIGIIHFSFLHHRGLGKCKTRRKLLNLKPIYILKRSAYLYSQKLCKPLFFCYIKQ
jgi:hypothetical protein